MQGHWGFLTWAVRKAILMRSSSPETRTRHSSSPGRDLWHNVKSYYLQWRRAALSSPSSDMINFESFSSIRELIYINSEFQPWLTNNIFFLCLCLSDNQRRKTHCAQMWHSYVFGLVLMKKNNRSLKLSIHEWVTGYMGQCFNTFFCVWNKVVWTDQHTNANVLFPSLGDDPK